MNSSRDREDLYYHSDHRSNLADRRHTRSVLYVADILLPDRTPVPLNRSRRNDLPSIPGQPGNLNFDLRGSSNQGHTLLLGPCYPNLKIDISMSVKVFKVTLSYIGSLFAKTNNNNHIVSNSVKKRQR